MVDTSLPEKTVSAGRFGEGALDAIVIGAGFAGLYMLHRLRELGLRALVLEAGSGIGGTWYWNAYPGARCDVDSLQYSYSWSEALQEEWTWTERYAAQPEILRYMNHVADRFDLRRDIVLDTRVTSARWDESQGRWSIGTESGQDYDARFLITAVGCLSDAQTPNLPGIERFLGPTLHTGRWPKAPVNLAGKRVGVIGTGSSGIQVIPEIAKQASGLWVFQRTANFSIPAWNGPIDEAWQRDWRTHHADYRARARGTRSGILYDYGIRPASDYSPAEREKLLEARWLKGGTNFSHAFSDGYTVPESNEHLADFVRRKIRETVKDPEVAERLTPRGHALGTKRLCVDSGYYATYNQPHVHLVDLKRTPITAVTPDGIQTTSALHKLDVIVMATGYDAVTGPLRRLGIVGTQGRSLNQLWAQGPSTYLGLMVSGFPNLLTITGPGSPSILTNVVVSIEQHVDWITGLIGHMQTRGWSRVEAQEAAQQDWTAQVRDAVEGTLFKTADSWYMGANIAGKPRGILPYVGGFARYTEICEGIASGGYRGFDFSGRRPPALSMTHPESVPPQRG